MQASIILILAMFIVGFSTVSAIAISIDNRDIIIETRTTHINDFLETTDLHGDDDTLAVIGQELLDLQEIDTSLSQQTPNIEPYFITNKAVYGANDTVRVYGYYSPHVMQPIVALDNTIVEGLELVSIKNLSLIISNTETSQYVEIINCDNYDNITNTARPDFILNGTDELCPILDDNGFVFHQIILNNTDSGLYQIQAHHFDISTIQYNGTVLRQSEYIDPKPYFTYFLVE